MKTERDFTVAFVTVKSTLSYRCLIRALINAIMY